MVGWSIRPYPAQEVEQPALTLCSYSPATVPWTDVLLSCRDKRMGRGDDREEVGESEVIALLITVSFVFLHYFCSCSLYATKQFILSFSNGRTREGG